MLLFRALIQKNEFSTNTPRLQCPKGGKCTIAYAEDGKMQAKCPQNLLSYEWEWPWIDHEAKTKQAIKECYKKAGIIDKVKAGVIDEKVKPKKEKCDKIVK